MKHVSPDSGGQMDGDTVTTWRLLNEWEAEGKPCSSVTDLVSLQTLIMAMISVDCVSLPSAKGWQGPTKLKILARAVGLGYSMGVHSRAIDPNPNPEQDPNSDGNVSLRAWWVLIMLDRWHALGVAKPTMIISDLTVPPLGLKHIVGETVFALIRESFSLHCLLLPPNKFNRGLLRLQFYDALHSQTTDRPPRVSVRGYIALRDHPNVKLAHPERGQQSSSAQPRLLAPPRRG